MKIIAYSIRDDERPYVENWEKEHPDVEVKIVKDLLTEKTADLAKGFDGAVVYQQKPYTAAILDKLASYGVKNLSLRNVGVDNVDRNAVKRDGFKVTNVTVYSPAAIAELAISQLLRLLRRTPQFDRRQAAGDLKWEPDIATELHSLTVGVIGTGHIGQAFIQIARGFGAKIVGYDPYPNPQLKAEGIYVDSLDELFAKADVIDLHAPATKENYHVLNDDAFSKMKDGVYIINAARGDLIDTDALIRALDSGKVAGAALDTYENEVGIFNTDFHDFDRIPDVRLKNLMSRNNVLVTPHVAFYTKTAVHNMVYYALDNNKSLIESGNAKFLVSFDDKRIS